MELMLVERWSSVVDGGPTLSQHLYNVLCLLGYSALSISSGSSTIIFVLFFQCGDSFKTSEYDGPCAGNEQAACCVRESDNTIRLINP